MSDYIDIKVVAQVIGTGLLLGAGLPLVFALGVRALSAGTEGATTGSDRANGFATTKSPVGLALGGVCLLVVAAAIVFGISIIVNKS